MDAPASLRFAQSARAVADTARALGLQAPGFRCPPRTPGAERTITRSDGEAVIAVRMVGRSFGDVVADMVEGVILVNQLRGERAMHARSVLWGAVAPTEAHAA